MIELVLADSVLEPITSLIDELQHQGEIRSYGLRPRSRILFVGPSGCGKSTTAGAVAHELGWLLVRVNLTSIVSSFLGETARNIQSIFDYCRAGSWVILFDEFDAVAKERADRSDHGELKRVVATFLQLLDQFHGTSLVVAATNHPSLLDTAVWRRFDDVLLFGPPSPAEIGPLLERKLAPLPHRLNVPAVIKRMHGMTQAEIEMICHSALRLAILQHRSAVMSADMSAAIRQMEARKRAIRGYSAT